MNEALRYVRAQSAAPLRQPDFFERSLFACLEIDEALSEARAQTELLSAARESSKSQDMDDALAKIEARALQAMQLVAVLRKQISKECRSGK